MWCRPSSFMFGRPPREEVVACAIISSVARATDLSAPAETRTPRDGAPHPPGGRGGGPAPRGAGRPPRGGPAPPRALGGPPPRPPGGRRAGWGAAPWADARPGARLHRMNPEPSTPFLYVETDVPAGLTLS